MGTTTVSLFIVFAISQPSQSLQCRSFQPRVRIYPALSRVELFDVGGVNLSSYFKEKKVENRNGQNRMKRSNFTTATRALRKNKYQKKFVCDLFYLFFGDFFVFDIT